MRNPNANLHLVGAQEQEHVPTASPSTGMDGSAAAQPLAERDDDTLVARARLNDAVAFELLMRRHNQRVYRVVRSLIKEPSEVEDVMQQTYMQAFVHLDQFEYSARWSTWVCRIAINEALARLRQQGRFVSMEGMSDEAMAHHLKAPAHDPERTAASHELGQFVERAIDNLPEIYRVVLVLREIEGMSTVEAAQVLGVDIDVIKTRLHRARTALRTTIEESVGEQMKNSYAFGNERCDRVVSAVLDRLKQAR